jgi:acetylornithine deacetylase
MSTEASQHIIYQDVLELLKKLIATPSFSKEENKTADLISEFLENRDIKAYRKGNNIWCRNRHYDKGKKTILLNSHHDTVKVNSGYTKDPFNPVIEGGKLYGLGSNDAGGPLMALLGTFLYFNEEKTLPWNLVFLASSEEENSGAGGLQLALPELGDLDCVIVGEPTGMNMAIAEKGLLVINCEAKGKAGHAAREEGINAIYGAMEDICWFRDFKFPKVSKLLGPVKMSVTIIEAGSLHNMVPESCRFVVDIRVNELYTHEEILEEIRKNIKSSVEPRSLRLRSTSISSDHPLVKAGLATGASIYGSPTLSDKALMPFPALKMGPGESKRSHTADEYIYTAEIESGLNGYITLFKNLLANQE